MQLRYIFLMLCAAGLLFCCQKMEEGFLSDNLGYRPNPFIAAQGVVAVSKAMDGDGSTMPLQVKLLEIRKIATGLPLDSEQLKPREVFAFTGAVSADDSTLALLNKKISKTMARPFEINSLGGRIELSAASGALEVGDYTFDVEVANVKGRKVLKNACTVQLTPRKYYEVLVQTLRTSTPNDESAPFIDVPGGLPVTIEKIADGPNKIIVKFLDKNGHPFNPAAGQLIKRGDRPDMSSFDPWYPQEKTDTALVFEYPAAPQFPMFKIAGFDYLVYYRIPYTANSTGRNLNATFTILLYDTGTWTYTFTIPNAEKL
jgi:hypothetical protein